MKIAGNNTPALFCIGKYAAVIFMASILCGCAARYMYGYENTFKTYHVPEELIRKIRAEFTEFGLPDAAIELDQTGRVRLTGHFRNEDEVDRAFMIITANVGVKSTSPFYPENVKHRRISDAMRQAIQNYASQAPGQKAGVKYALVIGVNRYLHPTILKDINGADDAKRVADWAEKSGFTVIDLIGSRATRRNIIKTVRELSRKIRPEDTLFLYVSTHGLPPIPSPEGKDARRMSMMAYDSGVPGIEKMGGTALMLALQKTSVPDHLFQQLAHKEIRVKRVLVDTCYSGNMFGIARNKTADQYIRLANNGKPELFGISFTSWAGDDIHTKGIASLDAPRQQTGGSQQKNDWRKNTGRNFVVITATSSGEESYGPAENEKGLAEFTLDDGTRLVGSYFTQSFLEYLERFGNRIGSAFWKASEFTQQEVYRLSREKRTQTPRMYPYLDADDPLEIY
ncbi:MAG: caspase family protein [Oxalobacter formigenes]|nr:caspase family protein [Oxalobacter formigenes]